jgi:hypothetical protein
MAAIEAETSSTMTNRSTSHRQDLGCSTFPYISQLTPATSSAPLFEKSQTWSAPVLTARLFRFQDLEIGSTEETIVKD